MHMHEDIVLQMIRERMQDAERRAEESRALRLARGPRQPARVRLGLALVRLGHWIMGQPAPSPRPSIGFPQAQT